MTEGPAKRDLPGPNDPHLPVYKIAILAIIAIAVLVAIYYSFLRPTLLDTVAQPPATETAR